MRKLILKWLNGIPNEELGNYLNQVYSLKIELETQQREKEIWKRQAMSYKHQLESIPAKLDEMNLSRNLKRAIINKLSKG